MKQIVISVPDRVYECITGLEPSETTTLNSVLIEGLRNGTLLPEGHGRLGDLSRLVEVLNEAQVEGTAEYKGLGVAKQIVENTSTLVVADNDLD